MKQIKQRFFLLFALGSFIMFGALAQTNTWNGNTDTDWHKTCNWSLNLIPTCAHDVVIPTVTSYPSITGIAHCNTISITSAAANTLTINSAGGARLDVGLGGSCSGTPTNNLSVPAAPVATAASNILCNSYTANWNASAGATAYYLDWGDDLNGWTSLNNNVGGVTFYNIAGQPGSCCDYFYRVRASNACGTSANSNQIWFTPVCCINSTDPTGATASINPTCPAGSPTDLSVTGGSLGTGASWKWYSGSCGGTFVGTGSPISVSPGVNTTYYVRAEGTCNTTACASVAITVGSAPATPGAITGPTVGAFTPCCVAGAGDYSIVAVPGATSYLWTSTRPTWTVLGPAPCFCDDVPCSCGTNVKICWGTTGIFNLCVQAVNACGTSAMSCITINKTGGTCVCC